MVVQTAAIRFPILENMHTVIQVSIVSVSGASDKRTYRQSYRSPSCQSAGLQTSEHTDSHTSLHHVILRASDERTYRQSYRSPSCHSKEFQTSEHTDSHTGLPHVIPRTSDKRTYRESCRSPSCHSASFRRVNIQTIIQVSIMSF